MLNVDADSCYEYETTTLSKQHIYTLHLHLPTHSTFPLNSLLASLVQFHSCNNLLHCVIVVSYQNHNFAEEHICLNHARSFERDPDQYYQPV